MDRLAILPSFEGDQPAAADEAVLTDRRELAIVAVERSRMPMVITDPRKPDNPIVLANQAFLNLTGYDAHEVVGQNCRFLQGKDTAEDALDAVRRGVRAEESHIEVELLNYRKDGSSFWNQLGISAVHDDDGKLLYFFASQKDVTTTRHMQKLEATERLLLMEVDHRAMNALALVQSIVSLSRADSVEEFSQSIRGRVDALARAHRLLADSRWTGAQFADVIALETSAPSVRLFGPPAMLPARLVQPLTLALHELITNAYRHGALAQDTGQVTISWEIVADALVVHWIEDALISPSEPLAFGVGLKLAKTLIEKQLGGEFSVKWGADGFRASLIAPWEFKHPTMKLAHA